VRGGKAAFLPAAQRLAGIYGLCRWLMRRTATFVGACKSAACGQCSHADDEGGQLTRPKYKVNFGFH